MYSAEEYARCLKLVTGLTEAERKEAFSTISYPSDSYLMGELLTLIPADTFVEAVKRYESTHKTVTWVKVTDEVPANMDNHYVTLFLKNMDTGECHFKVCTGWYEPWDDYSGHWYLSDGFEYDWFADEPCMLAEDFSKDAHVVSHVSAWSREIPEYGIEPFKP